MKLFNKTRYFFITYYWITEDKTSKGHGSYWISLEGYPSHHLLKSRADKVAGANTVLTGINEMSKKDFKEFTSEGV